MPPKRVGIIGYGHLGQFLRVELSKRPEQFEVRRLWNRTEDEQEGVRPLADLRADTLDDLDLVIEVAHPDIVRHHGALILRHCDFFVSRA